MHREITYFSESTDNPSNFASRRKGDGATSGPGKKDGRSLIRVLIADDHYLVRQGIRTLLEHAPGIDVIGEAGDGEEVVRLAASLKPDVVVMDISMPRQDGLAATSQLQDLNRRPRVVVLSMYANPTLVERAFNNGARGYLLKRSTAGELVAAIRAAYKGDTYLGSNLSGDIDHPGHASGG